MMKYFVTLVLFNAVTVIYASQLTCERNVQKLCSASPSDIGAGAIVNCNSIIGPQNWGNSQTRLKEYARDTLHRSYDLLGLAINHGSFSRSRPGFEKLFRQLSDESFNNAIKIMKYITDRGGYMEFDDMGNTLNLPEHKFNLNEFESISVAQTIEKNLLEFALRFTNETHGHDPNTLHFIEEKFIQPKSSVVRKVTGYVQDLEKLLKIADSSFNIYMFDQYLQKDV